MHRDLKPDNIMIVGYDSGDLSDLRVKLIDFGMAKLVSPKRKIDLNTYCGTIDFIAPEVLDEKMNYDEKCDIWSIGVIAFFLLSGRPPFYGQDDIQVQLNISTCNYDFDDEIWNEISKDGHTCIEGLLELFPKDRFDVDKALNHPWIKELKNFRSKLHPSVMLNLHGCHTPHRLHYELLTLFTMFLDDSDINSIRETFLFMDKDNGGDISTDELREAYQLLNKNNWFTSDVFKNSYTNEKAMKTNFKTYQPISNEKINEILSKVDQDGNGQIEYSEFLAHALTGKQLSKKNLQSFFQTMLVSSKESVSS